MSTLSMNANPVIGVIRSWDKVCNKRFQNFNDNKTKEMELIFLALSFFWRSGFWHSGDFGAMVSRFSALWFRRSDPLPCKIT